MLLLFANLNVKFRPRQMLIGLSLCQTVDCNRRRWLSISLFLSSFYFFPSIYLFIVLSITFFLVLLFFLSLSSSFYHFLSSSFIISITFCLVLSFNLFLVLSLFLSLSTSFLISISFFLVISFLCTSNFDLTFLSTVSVLPFIYLLSFTIPISI